MYIYIYIYIYICIHHSICKHSMHCCSYLLPYPQWHAVYYHCTHSRCWSSTEAHSVSVKNSMVNQPHIPRQVSLGQPFKWNPSSHAQSHTPTWLLYAHNVDHYDTQEEIPAIKNRNKSGSLTTAAGTANDLMTRLPGTGFQAV